jgi:hypothetical protein
MAILTVPAGFDPRRFSLTLRVNQRVSGDPLGISEQAVDMLADRWVARFDSAPANTQKSAGIEALIAKLRGATNVIPLYHYARPNPFGTIAGAKTVQTAAVQGAATLKITATGTLLAGDMIGVTSTGGKVLLLMVADDCTAASGVITAPLVNRLRDAVSLGAAVTTNKPFAYFRLSSAIPEISFQRNYGDGAQFTMLEALL